MEDIQDIIKNSKRKRENSNSPEHQNGENVDLVTKKRAKKEVMEITLNSSSNISRFPFQGNNIGFHKGRCEQTEKQAEESPNNNHAASSDEKGEEVLNFSLGSVPFFMRDKENSLRNYLENLTREEGVEAKHRKLYQECLAYVEGVHKLLGEYSKQIEEDSQHEALSRSLSSPSLERASPSPGRKNGDRPNCVTVEERIFLSLLFSHNSFSSELWEHINFCLASRDAVLMRRYGYLVGTLHRLSKRKFGLFSGLAFKFSRHKRYSPLALISEPYEESENGEEQREREYCESILSSSFVSCSQDPTDVLPCLLRSSDGIITPHEVADEKGCLFVFQCKSALRAPPAHAFAESIVPTGISENEVILPPKTEFKLVHSNTTSLTELRQLLSLICGKPIPSTIEIVIFREAEQEESQLHLEQIIVDSWNGNREAQYKLGSYYYWGKEGLQKNFEKAYLWLLRAANQVF